MLPAGSKSLKDPEGRASKKHPLILLLKKMAEIGKIHHRNTKIWRSRKKEKKERNAA